MIRKLNGWFYNFREKENFKTTKSLTAQEYVSCVESLKNKHYTRICTDKMQEYNTTKLELMKFFLDNVSY